MPGHKVLLRDLEIAHDLQGDDLVLRVNKAGVLVFRARLCDAQSEKVVEGAKTRRGRGRRNGDAE